MSKKLIAITGGIGSGKSTVSSIIRERGFFVVSADEIVTKLYTKRAFLKELKRLFPNAVKGILFIKVDKKAISKEVFNDKKKLQQLNCLTHSKVMNEIKRELESQDKTCFAEVPLLFEGDYQNLFDNTIVVKRKLEDRVESVIKRSNLSKEEVLERIKNQFDYDKADLSKYIVIENDGDENTLKQKVIEVINSL